MKIELSGSPADSDCATTIRAAVYQTILFPPRRARTVRAGPGTGRRAVAVTNPVSSAKRAATSNGLPSTVNGVILITGGFLGGMLVG